jgi:hypothetical protein
VATSRPKWGPVQTKVFEDIFEPETLHREIPKLGEVAEGAELLRSLDEEIGVVGKFQKAAGFTTGRSAQRVAKIDTNLMLMLDNLHEADCTCSRSLWGTGWHKEWFFAWLETYGKAYDSRVKIEL